MPGRAVRGFVPGSAPREGRPLVASRARKRTPLKGRSVVAISLTLLVMVALIVVWRRSIGVAGAREMRDLNRERAALLSQKTTLETQLEVATSRPRIILAAERRLGLHVATESQTRVIADSTITP